MLLRQLFDFDTCTYTYLLADERSGDAVIIDSVIGKVDRDLRLMGELGLRLVYIFDTHVHADHVTGAGKLREATGAVTIVGQHADVECVDQCVAHGDRVSFGAFEVEVRSTPGHTSGCVTFIVRDGDTTMAFTGDAVLVRGCGRTDFQEGSASTLYHSVHDQVFSLPEDTVIYPGHDYRGHSSSTVGEELSHNPRLNRDVSESQFVTIMENLDLAPPKHMSVALPANLACGKDVPSQQEA